MILVIDLEATCADDGTIPSDEMEIIEIGACWAELDGHVIDRFQCFVRPVLRPVLTPFCVGLTGIRQEDVDDAQPFNIAVDRLREFVDRQRQISSIWTSWGKYDCNQLARECARHQVLDPIQLEHVNAKRLFAKKRKIGKEVGLAKACQLVGFEFTGAHHRGLDDALNVARLLPYAFGSGKN